MTVIALSVLPYILYCAGYYCVDENECRMSVMKGMKAKIISQPLAVELLRHCQYAVN